MGRAGIWAAQSAGLIPAINAKALICLSFKPTPCTGTALCFYYREIWQEYNNLSMNNVALKQQTSAQWANLTPS
jgi:hypothetical protein